MPFSPKLFSPKRGPVMRASILLKILFAFLVISAASSCASKMSKDPGSDPPSLAEDKIWKRITPTQIMVGAPGAVVTADVALQNEANLRAALSSYLAPGTPLPANLGQAIAAIRQSASPGLKGIGGVSGEAFLYLAEQALGPGGNFATGKKVEAVVSGQIVDYSFDAATGNGRIVSATYIDKVINGSTPPNQRQTFVWEVTVVKEVSDPDSGFRVLGRQSGSNPFPEAPIEYPPDLVERIQALYPFKLWAMGTSINIDNVWYRQTPQSKWKKIDDNHRFKGLKDEDPKNCIDMLFTATPPSSLDGLSTPPFYCLGRCDRPFLVNTGY